VTRAREQKQKHRQQLIKDGEQNDSINRSALN
jgi:hypothetical protein